MSFNDFVKKYPSLANNHGAKKVFDFLADDETVISLIVFSRSQLPAISGIVQSLESNFASDPDFPLTEYKWRQIVGKMVKFILENYGYVPIDRGLNERTYLRSFSNARYFKTAAIYNKANSQPIKISVTV